MNGSLVTGNVAAGANVTGTVLAMPIPAGLYSGSMTATASNTNLLDTNIKKNVTIFGVLGTYGESAPVPRTGQTPTVPIVAPVGSDGNLQKGVIWPSSSSEPPSARFKSNSANTVTDNLTGLMWAKNANIDGIKSWAAALTYCNGLTIDYLSGWRLPNYFELVSLLDLAYFNPALSNDAGTGKWVSGNVGSSFTGVQSLYYWSSTTDAANPTTAAWYVNLASGDAYSGTKVNSASVWPVRGGQ